MFDALPPPAYVTLGGVSLHVPAHTKNHTRRLRGLHPGLGVEFRARDGLHLGAGFYRNSYGDWVGNLGAKVTPLDLGPARLGFVAAWTPRVYRGDNGPSKHYEPVMAGVLLALPNGADFIVAPGSRTAFIINFKMAIH